MSIENKTSVSEVDSNGLFGLCRDCHHWRPATNKQHLPEYPRDRKVEDGYINGRCDRIRDGADIDVSGGWDGAVVDGVFTDANFGCALFEPNMGDIQQ